MKSIKLKKTIISNKYAKELFKKDFTNLTQSDSSIDGDRLTEIYDDIFYKIPKKGKKSHTDLINQSYDHIYHNNNKKTELKIKNLIEKLSIKETELSNVDNSFLKEHPIYENGSILIAGENGMAFQDMNTKYIMQEGRKRAFDNDDVFKLTKKLLKLPLDDLDGRYYVSLDQLNSIPDSPPIATTSDLNIKGTDLIIDLPDILGISAYVDVEFECLGNEISDYVGALTNPLDTDYDIDTFQFYTNNDSCVIKYIQDDYTNDELGPSVLEKSIPKGETEVIRLLRRSENSNNMIPTNINTYYESNIPININYNGNSITNYERNWGPYGDYESVVYAEGRIMSKEIPNASIGNALLQSGEQQDTSLKLFNGLPTKATGTWGEADIVVISDPSYTGQEKSIYNTKMIYKISGAYGSLNQSSDLQSKVFDNPQSIYYKPEFYGQPILRYNNTYCVIRKAYMGGFFTRKAIFVNVQTGGEFKKTRTQIQDAMGFEMDYNSDPYNMIWPTLNVDRIAYIGLTEVKTKLQPSDRNVYNPLDQGSDYGLNSYNTPTQGYQIS